MLAPVLGLTPARPPGTEPYPYAAAILLGRPPLTLDGTLAAPPEPTLVRASGLISLEPAANPPTLLPDMGAAPPPALLLDAVLPGGADEGLATVASAGDEPLNPAPAVRGLVSAAVRGLVSAAVRGLVSAAVRGLVSAAARGLVWAWLA
jgi:hypothetical protein